MSKRVIAIEGTIGAGKTTLVKRLAECRNAIAITEPIREWSKSGLLKKFYQNPKAHALALQEKAYDSFKRKGGDGLCIQERSLYSAYYVFTVLMLKFGYIQQEEFDKLTKRFEETLPETERINLIIYVRTPPEEALKRVKRRARVAEKDLTLDYLVELHRLYENVFCKCERRWYTTIFIADGRKGQEDVFRQVLEFLDDYDRVYNPSMPKPLSLKPLTLELTRTKLWKPRDARKDEKQCDYCKGPIDEAMIWFLANSKESEVREEFNRMCLSCAVHAEDDERPIIHAIMNDKADELNRIADEL